MRAVQSARRQVSSATRHGATAALALLAGRALGGCDAGALDDAASAPINASGASLWSADTRPGAIADADRAAVEVGVKFRVDVAGHIASLRFYKAAENTGAHVGHLWTDGGVLLGTVAFAHESASGWQSATFAAPVAVSAGQTYVASYHTDTGHYADDANFFAAQGEDRAPLHAPRDGVDGPNGVFRYGASGFPTSGWHASNYWVDVVFDANPAPADAGTPRADAAADAAHDAGAPRDTTPPAQVTGLHGAASSSTTVALGWTAATDNVGVTGYVVYRDGARLGTATGTSFTDTTAAASTRYAYTISARDAAGNEGAQSSPITVTTPAAAVGSGDCFASPHTCGYPDETTTGVAAGTPLIDVPGSVRSGAGWAWDARGWVAVTGAGAVFAGYRVAGSVEVYGVGAVVRGNEIIGSSTSEDWIVGLRPSAHNVVLSDNSIHGTVRVGTDRVTYGIFGDLGGDADSQILRNNIYLVDHPLQQERGLIQDNYAHEIASNGLPGGMADHADVLFVGGGTPDPLTIRHNTLINDWTGDGSTSAIILSTAFGAETNRLVENNLLAGGGFVVYGGVGAAQGSNIVFRDNVFSTHFYPNGGFYGPVAYYSASYPGDVWTNNTWLDGPNAGRAIVP